MQNQKTLTVNEILAHYGAAYIKQHPWISDRKKKIIRLLSICRTEAMGGRKEKCEQCGFVQYYYNSCRDRHCPLCQSMKKEAWITSRQAEVLPFQYFHVVFTVPDELTPLYILNNKQLYTLHFNAVKEVLINAASNKRYFGARIGFFSILHTWGQKLQVHPHIHCVVPGGGYDKTTGLWKKCPDNFFIHVNVLKGMFKYAFLTKLKKLLSEEEINIGKTDNANKLKRLVDLLWKKDWVVYCKESFKDEKSVISYLSRYTHKIAITNNRIKRIQDGEIIFSYKDYSDNNKIKEMKLPVYTFISRFLLHVLPKHFVRIRYYGILSHRSKKAYRQSCLDYYMLQDNQEESASTWQEIFFRITGTDPTLCPNCKEGRLIFAGEIPRTRDPPALYAGQKYDCRR